MFLNGTIIMSLNNMDFQIISPSSCMLSGPSMENTLLNEALFGETVRVISEEHQFLFVKLLTDNYQGWINKKDIGNLPKASHTVTNIRSFVYSEKNLKKKILTYLPFGSKVSLIKKFDFWSSISMDIKNQTIGFIPNSHISEITKLNDDWVSTAKLFINVPYKWGGRNSLGLDCSSLIQLSLSSYVQFPRDTIFQEKMNFAKINLSEITRGCIVFWKGHVGVMVDKYNLLHANAYHMKVKIESLEDLNKRKETSLNKITTIMKI